MNPDQSDQLFRKSIGPIVFLTSLFLLNFLARVIMAPMMPTVERELGIGHHQAGSLFLMITIGYFITVALSGFVSSRIGHRATIILSAVAIGLGLFIASICQSLITLQVSLIVLGLGAGLYLPSGMASLTELVLEKHWGKAIAIHELAPSLSLILAPIIVELFLARFDWRAILVALGLAALILSLAFAKWGKGGRFKGETPKPKIVKEIMSGRTFWILSALFAFGVGGSLGIYSMLPLYLVSEMGMTRSSANTLVSVSRLSTIIIPFVSGWMTDRFGHKKALRAIFIATGLATILLALAKGNWLLVMVFVQPACAVCFFPAGFAALLTIGQPAQRNVVISVAFPLALVVGAGAIPTILGWFGHHDLFWVGIMMVGGLGIIGAFLANLLRE